MQMKLWTKVIAVLPMMCLAAFASAAQSQDSSQQQTGDPVADAARKARETKKDAPKPQKAMTQQNTRGDVNAITAKIDAKKQELAQLRQGLDDLEDQLRKSGGNAGWAR